MPNRFQDALDIQSACNPSGVAYALVRHMEAFIRSPEYKGTASICQDPALRLMVYQLSYLMGMNEGVAFDNFNEAYSACCTRKDQP